MTRPRSRACRVVEHRREHLEGFIEMRSGTTRRDRGLSRVRRVVVCIRILRRHSDIDSHAMFEVLEPCDQRVAMAVLEDNAPALIQTVEVLDCCNDGVCRVVGVDVHSHGQAGLCARRLGE
jgi:hypothetical protein